MVQVVRGEKSHGGLAARVNASDERNAGGATVTRRSRHASAIRRESRRHQVMSYRPAPTAAARNSICVRTARAAHLGGKIAHDRAIVEIEPASRDELIVLVALARD